MNGEHVLSLRCAILASPRVRRRRLVVAVASIALFVAVVAARTLGGAGRTTRSSRAAPVPALERLAVDTRSGALPEARSRAAAVADGDTVVLLGGLVSRGRTTASVDRFDPQTGALAHLGDLAEPTHDAAAATVGGATYVFGGGTTRVSDLVQRFDVRTGSRVIGHLPTPRADAASIVVGTTAYVVGGYDGRGPALDVLATGDGASFRTVGRLVKPARYPAVAAIGATVYVFGGEWNGAPSSTVQAIDLRDGRVRVVASLPQPRSLGTAFVLDGHVDVAGGATTAIIQFDPVRRSFATVGELPQTRAAAAIVALGNHAVVVGGESESGAPTTDITMIRRGTVQPTADVARQSPFAGRLLIADRGNDRLIVVDAQKRLIWEYPSARSPAPPGGFYFPDDGFFVAHSSAILTNEEENFALVRIAFPSGRTLWTYGHPGQAGSASGYLDQPDDAFLLRDSTTVVADAKNCRILFIGADARPLSQIGTTRRCVHDPPRSLGYPNGDTPLPDGTILVSEVNGSWISDYRTHGDLVWTVKLPIAYPSDPQQLGPDLYLVADYTRPGGVVEFTREGNIVWQYRPAQGAGMLDHPSLAERLPNGLICVNDDYRHRVVVIDPVTKRIVWQYGETDHAGRGYDQLDTPDGFDLRLPDGSTPQHVSTG